MNTTRLNKGYIFGWDNPRPRMGVLLAAELINLGPWCLLFNVVVSSWEEKPNFFFVSEGQLKIASWLKIGAHVHFPLSAMGHWLDPEHAITVFVSPCVSVCLVVPGWQFLWCHQSLWLFTSFYLLFLLDSWALRFVKDLIFRTGVPKFILCLFPTCGSLCYFSCTPRGIFFHGIWARHQSDHSLFWPRLGKSCHFTLLKQILGVQKHGYLFFKTDFFL